MAVTSTREEGRIFGVEVQVRELDQVSDAAIALIGKIRVPIGILVYGLRTRT